MVVNVNRYKELNPDDLKGKSWSVWGKVGVERTSGLFILANNNIGRNSLIWALLIYSRNMRSTGIPPSNLLIETKKVRMVSDALSFQDVASPSLQNTYALLWGTWVVQPVKCLTLDLSSIFISGW